MGKLCLLLRKKDDETKIVLVQNNDFPEYLFGSIKLRLDLSPRQITRAKSNCIIPADNIGPLLDVRNEFLETFMVEGDRFMAFKARDNVIFATSYRIFQFFTWPNNHDPYNDQLEKLLDNYERIFNTVKYDWNGPIFEGYAKTIKTSDELTYFDFAGARLLQKIIDEMNDSTPDYEVLLEIENHGKKVKATAIPIVLNKEIKNNRIIIPLETLENKPEPVRLERPSIVFKDLLNTEEQMIGFLEKPEDSHLDTLIVSGTTRAANIVVEPTRITIEPKGKETTRKIEEILEKTPINHEIIEYQDSKEIDIKIPHRKGPAWYEYDQRIFFPLVKTLEKIGELIA